MLQCNYQKRMIAYLDVLGWKDLVSKSLTNVDLMTRIGFALIEVQRFVGNHQKNSEQSQIDLQISQFSDSIGISALNGPPIFFEAIRIIVNEFINMGFPIRGGITNGSLVHRGNIIYGPGLNEAYRVESEIAFYPRILIDHTFSNNFDALEKHMIIRKDIDGYYHFDYLQPGFLFPKSNNPNYIQELQQKMNSVRGIIMRGLQVEHMSKYYMKYKWMAFYFNEIWDENSQIQDEVQRIELEVPSWDLH